MRLTILIGLVLGWLCGAGSVLADTESEIRAALDYFAEVWQEGDLQTIRGYYHADFVLITPDGPVSLAQRMADLDAVAKSGEDRGELTHSAVKIRTLSDGHALAWGKRRLAFGDGSSIEIWFSTVYAKTPFGWKAILTHQ